MRYRYQPRQNESGEGESQHELNLGPKQAETLFRGVFGRADNSPWTTSYRTQA